jgi:hypothetical protein
MAVPSLWTFSDLKILLKALFQPYLHGVHTGNLLAVLEVRLTFNSYHVYSYVSLLAHLGFNPLDMIPGRLGVPQTRLSGFEKFEAPDPAEWTSKGYAIVNADPRGVYDSEGDI